MWEHYRLGCPKEKHTNLKRRSKGGYYCDSCKQYYPKVIDLKTGKKVTRNPQVV